MSKWISIIFFLIIPFSGFAQVTVYSSLSIPDSLKTNADMVIREELIKLSIKDKNTARYEVHRVYTILNEKAKKYLSFVQYSDKFHLLDDAEIKIFDLAGNKKNTWSKKDMTSGKYGDELVPEGMYTFFNVSAPSYPLTVEINFSIKYNGTFSLPDYLMQAAWQSVQQSVFEVEVPAELGVRYKLLNTKNKPQIKRDGNKEIYRWEQKNIPAFKLEKHSGSSDTYLPQILLAPNKFQLDEYEGDMTSWKNYGIWFNLLYAKVSGLSDSKKLFYQNLVKNAGNENEKAFILYKYMQNHMRYVSIQLGIGGLRPFPASFVEEKKYGDCKALSNYLKSTLDAVGIKSNLVIIYRDYEPKIVDELFPKNNFNHVILCIPQVNDSIWLECTSTSLPFAELDETTLNRKAVMITDNGGVLVNTPPSNFKNNIQNIHTVIEIDDEGGAKVNTVFTLFGEERDKQLKHFHDMKEDEKKRVFISDNDWKHPEIIELTNSRNKDNPYRINAGMEYDKIFSFKAGSKYFFEPRLYPLFREDIIEQEKRHRDYYFTYPYQSTDTTIYKFPPGYAPESIPKNKSVLFPFTQYASNYSWDAASKTFTIIASLQIKDRVIKAADYTRLVDFKKQVIADMNEKIVMKKE